MSVTSTVKDTAARVGLPSRTLRYYDSIGLVCPPRTASGYRIYGPEEEGRLRFVRQAKTLGFSLEEIRELIVVADQGDCSDVGLEVERLLDEKIAAIDAQVAKLGTFRERLVAYRSAGHSGCGCSDHDVFCGCLNGAAPAGAVADLSQVVAPTGPATTPPSWSRPTSTSESPSTSERISSVCSPSSGARRTGTRSSEPKLSGEPDIR